MVESSNPTLSAIEKPQKIREKRVITRGPRAIACNAGERDLARAVLGESAEACPSTGEGHVAHSLSPAPPRLRSRQTQGRAVRRTGRTPQRLGTPVLVPDPHLGHLGGMFSRKAAGTSDWAEAHQITRRTCGPTRGPAPRRHRPRSLSSVRRFRRRTAASRSSRRSPYFSRIGKRPSRSRRTGSTRRSRSSCRRSRLHGAT